MLEILINALQKKQQTANVLLPWQPHPQERTAQHIDTTSGLFSPAAVPQILIETFGNQRSPALNQDIIPVGDFSNFHFKSITQNMYDANDVTVINPVIDTKTSNALLYQGYCVMDGDM